MQEHKPRRGSGPCRLSASMHVKKASSVWFSSRSNCLRRSVRSKRAAVGCRHRRSSFAPRSSNNSAGCCDGNAPRPHNNNPLKNSPGETSRREGRACAMHRLAHFGAYLRTKRRHAAASVADRAHQPGRCSATDREPNVVEVTPRKFCFRHPARRAPHGAEAQSLVRRSGEPRRTISTDISLPRARRSTSSRQ